MAARMDNIPDELLLTILRQLQAEPDILFNITPFVSNRFTRLSYDKSLWKTFCVPGHWHFKKAGRFFQSHPVASTIQKLTCCRHVLDELTNLRVALLNVTKLSVSEDSEGSCKNCSYSDHTFSYAEDTPALFPNLQFLDVPDDYNCGRECVEQLRKVLPQLELSYSGQIRAVETLLCPAVNKERLSVSSGTVEQVVRNEKQHLLRNSVISLCLHSSDYSVLRNLAIGQAILELTITCDVSVSEVKTISESCPKLELLYFASCQRSHSPSSLKTMLHLKDVKLKSYSMPSPDIMAIVNASPSLRHLNISACGNISPPRSSCVCSLPRSLRSLDVRDNAHNHDFFHCLLQSAQHCPRLTCIKLRPISLFCKGNEWLSVKVWPHFSEASLDGYRVHVPRQLLLQFANEKARMTKLQLSAFQYSIEEFQVIGCFSSLRELKLIGTGSHREDYPTSQLASLATKCPALESISIHIDAEAEQCTDDDLNNYPKLANIMPLMTALNSYDYLKWFSLMVSHDAYGLWVLDEDIPVWEDALDGAFKPWRLHTVLSHNLWFKQCPPAYRF